MFTRRRWKNSGRPSTSMILRSVSTFQSGSTSTTGIVLTTASVDARQSTGCASASMTRRSVRTSQEPMTPTPSSSCRETAGPHKDRVETMLADHTTYPRNIFVDPHLGKLRMFSITDDQRELRRKPCILRYADHIGNVRKTCRPVPNVQKRQLSVQTPIGFYAQATFFQPCHSIS